MPLHIIAKAQPEGCGSVPEPGGSAQAGKPVLLDGDDFEGAFAAEDLGADVLGVAVDGEVHASGADA
ncbi:MAG: hypothetical protein ACRD5W_08580, partial [Candidatus Acidiferrales bacterium]